MSIIFSTLNIDLVGRRFAVPLLSLSASQTPFAGQRNLVDMAARVAAPWRGAIGAPARSATTTTEMTIVVPKKLRRSSRGVAAPTPSSRDQRQRFRSRPTLVVAAATAAAGSLSPSPSSTPRPRYRVAVVGGGVIGLSTALRLAEEAQQRRSDRAEDETAELEISVFARGFEAETTSSGAGGLWEPYKLGDTPSELVNRWSAETLEFLVNLAREGEGGEHGSENAAAGVLEGPIFQFWTAPAPRDPSWAAVAPGFRRLREDELRSALEVAELGAESNKKKTTKKQRLRLPAFALEAPAVVDGWTFASAAAQPSRYLPWLMRRAEGLGVKFVRRDLSSLEELFNDGDGGHETFFDAVINCAGLAGGDLSGDDATPPTPVRGQVARLRYPSALSNNKKSALLADGGGAAGLFLDEETYLIRNVDFVVAGGTGQVGDADTEPRASDRESILARVRLLSPGLVAENVDGSNREEVEDWAGLRPLRSPVRLEARAVEVEEEEEEKASKLSSSPLPPKAETPRTRNQARRSVLVVSNYGHGGSGFTLHWGCAGDAAALVLEKLLKGRDMKMID